MIKYLDIHQDRNVYVVGDIHGCYTKLINELEKLNFDFNDDILLSVGDIVDRGPENEKCLTLLDEDWFDMVRGNHEDFCLKGVNDYRTEFYHKHPQNGGAWLYSKTNVEKEQVVQKLKDLPYMLEVSYRNKKFGLVHADLPIHDWDVLKLMLENDDIWNDREIKDHLVWGRDLVYHDYADIANIDYVFLGHTVLDQYKKVGNAIFIDTGAVFNRDFTILKLSDFI